MPVNANQPQRWKADLETSIDLYNTWFLQFAPQAFRDTRVQTTIVVESALRLTDNLTNLTPAVLRQNPSVLAMLRMATSPPLARDRLIGLARVSESLVESMEKGGQIPARMPPALLEAQLQQIAATIAHLADRDLFTWLDSDRQPEGIEVRRAASIVADRLCGAVADPIIRNAQEARQVRVISHWLADRGYARVENNTGHFSMMAPGTFAVHLNVPGQREDGQRVNIPVDVVIMGRAFQPGDFPLLVEAKSAGDFANTNKRRKEEANKITNLRRRYGPTVPFILLLCGYFNSGYLGFAAADGIDWVWEHRLDDLALFGV